MLESGITTVQHLHGVRVGPASRVFGIAERILKAYDDIGMRVSYSYALRDQNRLVYEADEEFCKRLPAPLGGVLREYLQAQRGAGRFAARAPPARGGAAAASIPRDLSARPALLRRLVELGAT
jgi:hypothetical protein